MTDSKISDATVRDAAGFHLPMSSARLAARASRLSAAWRLYAEWVGTVQDAEDVRPADCEAAIHVYLVTRGDADAY